MTLLSPHGNPYLRTPPTVAADRYVSGGGGDGCIDVVVALLLRWARPATAPITGAPTDFGGRGFELAELVARAAAAAGVTPVPPRRALQLRAACTNAGADLPSATAGLACKGAVLFDGSGTVGVSLGVRGRALIYEPAAGLVVDDAMAVWVSAARLPGAWGYRT